MDLQEVLSEIHEAYEALEPRLQDLEQYPEVVLTEVFRFVHTAKGACGFLELNEYQSFAHEFESFLGAVRERRLQWSSSLIPVIEEGLNLLVSWLRSAEDTQTGQTNTKGFLLRIQKLLNHSATFDTEELLQDLADLVNSLRRNASQLQQSQVLEIVKAADILRPLHHQSVDFRVQIVLKNVLMKEVSHQGRNITTEVQVVLRALEELVQNPHSFNKEEAQAVESALNTIQGLIDKDRKVKIFEFSTLVDLNLRLEGMVSDYFHIFWNELVMKADRVFMLEPKDFMDQVFAPELEISRSSVQEEVGVQEFTRVDLHSIENFTRTTEQLLTHKNQIENMETEIRSFLPLPLASELKYVLNGLSQSIHSLHSGLERVRTCRVDTIFQRIPRVIRQLERELGKKVRLKTSGSNLLIDRLLLPIINEPVLHLVRNALDHGIETVSERQAAGKDSVGLLEIVAYIDTDQLTIEVSDDGRGVDLQKVKQVAAKRGIPIQDSLDEDGVLALLCTPGFSTSEKVTSVSGRGVGLDVVNSRMKQAGGNLKVYSKPGLGTRLVLRLPLKQGVLTQKVLLLRVGNEPFALPESCLMEILQGTQVVLREGHSFLHRNRFFPCIGLSQVLRTKSDCSHGGAILLIKDSQSQEFGVLVDGVDKVMQAVVQNLEAPSFRKHPLIAGSAMLGRGRPVLLLDPDGISAGLDR